MVTLWYINCYCVPDANSIYLFHTYEVWWIRLNTDGCTGGKPACYPENLHVILKTCISSWKLACSPWCYSLEIILINLIIFLFYISVVIRDADIVQIPALYKQKVFDQYVLPNKNISSSANAVTGITYNRSNGTLLHKGQPVPAVTQHEALTDFWNLMNCLSSKNVKSVLIGQNIGLNLFNDNTCPSGHISGPTQLNVSQSCFYSPNKLLKPNYIV